MSYTLEVQCEDADFLGVFQSIQRILGFMVGSDATDPLNHLSVVLPSTTPMAPCHAGADHTAGVWLPIRRSRIAKAEGAPAATVEVDDAEPFKVGDTVQLIDVAGPATAVLNLGAITIVDYTLNVLTVTNANIQALDDWVEVTENGAVDTNHFIGEELLAGLGEVRQIGLLKDACDMRVNVSGTVQDMTAEAVIEGSIREPDINWNTTPALDQILADSLMKRNPKVVHVITRPHT